jgi:hypothetical protein
MMHRCGRGPLLLGVEGSEFCVSPADVANHASPNPLTKVSTTDTPFRTTVEKSFRAIVHW